MNPYILKTLLEIIVLLILYIVVLRQDQRISFLENDINKEDFELMEKGIINNSRKNIAFISFGKLQKFDKEPSFKSKVAKETKRIKSVKK